MYLAVEFTVALAMRFFGEYVDCCKVPQFQITRPYFGPCLFYLDNVQHTKKHV